MNPSPPEAPSEGPFLQFVLWVVLFGGPALLVAGETTGCVECPDIWWHLRTGQWMIEHGSVPVTDSFSRTEQGQPWIAYSWLFEIGVYRCYQAFRLFGILILCFVLVLAIVLSLHQLLLRYEHRFIEGGALFAVAVLALVPLMYERPWLFTILFSIWTLATVVAFRRGPAPTVAWLLPLVFVFWANLHIQFIYGLAILGLGCLAPLFDLGLGWSQAGATASTLGSRGWRQLVLLSALCFVATLVNPYHLGLYQVVLDLAAQTGVYERIDELAAPSFRTPFDWAGLALFGASAFALGRQSRFSSFEWLLLFAAAFCTFRARRDVWFLVIVAPVIVSSAANPDSRPRPRWGQTLRQSAFLAATTIGLALICLWVRAISNEQLEKGVANRYPVKAVAFLRERHFPGPIYNPYNWGGYLIWELPELPVTIDGRANLHGDVRINRHIDTWRGLPGWENDEELMTANVVLARNNAPLVSVLRQDSRFQVAYEDEIAVVFLRTQRSEDAERGPAK